VNRLKRQPGLVRSRSQDDPIVPLCRPQVSELAEIGDDEDGSRSSDIPAHWPIRCDSHREPNTVHLMRRDVEILLALGPLPAKDALDEQSARQYQDAIDALPAAPTAEEAVALLGIFPPDDSSSFGLAWSILHVIEASPEWPVWPALDDRNWWITHLRESCERAGLTRPD
jgi:hypothetical protein